MTQVLAELLLFLFKKQLAISQVLLSSFVRVHCLISRFHSSLLLTFLFLLLVVILLFLVHAPIQG